MSGSSESVRIPTTELVQWVFDRIRAEKMFAKKSLARESGYKVNHQDFSLAVHAAIERMRSELGVVFQPTGMGTIYRVADPTQVIRRSDRFARAAKKKLIRSSEMLGTISENSVPEEQREMLRRKQEHAEMRASKALRNVSLRKDLRGLARQGKAGQGKAWVAQSSID